MRNFIVTIDGKQYEVGVEEVGSTVTAPTATLAQAPAAAPAAAPKAAPKAAASNALANGKKVNAPMPGLIKALSKEEGAMVKRGDVILVLEAMKMDNDITAPCDGKISYKVTKGTNVDTGVLMAVIG